MGVLEIGAGVIALLIAWVAKLKYTLKNKEIEEAISESEILRRQTEIKNFETVNKEAYDEIIDYISDDSNTLDKF